MPKTAIKFYRDEGGSVPVLEWLTTLSRRKPKAYVKCAYLLELLGEFGSELRRPRADYLRDGIYELRTMDGNVNYPILYGFVGRNVARLAAGLTKEKNRADARNRRCGRAGRQAQGQSDKIWIRGGAEAWLRPATLKKFYDGERELIQGPIRASSRSPANTTSGK